MFPLMLTQLHIPQTCAVWSSSMSKAQTSDLHCDPCGSIADHHLCKQNNMPTRVSDFSKLLNNKLPTYGDQTNTDCQHADTRLLKTAMLLYM